MDDLDLSTVDVVFNDTGKEIVLFFEPRCEQITVEPGCKIEVLAEVETECPKFELKRQGNEISVFCLTSDALWYVKKDGVIKPTMEWVYGVTHDEMHQWHENQRKPWWKFW